MSEHPTLFITDIYDALGDLVRACGGPKVVGMAMKPEKTADDAAGWVKDCLNRNRPQKFDAEQIMWLLKKGREVGCHDPIVWINNEAGYTAPSPIEPETELAKLLREYNETGKRLIELQPKIEEAKTKLRVA